MDNDELLLKIKDMFETKVDEVKTDVTKLKSIKKCLLKYGF